MGCTVKYVSSLETSRKHVLKLFLFFNNKLHQTSKNNNVYLRNMASLLSRLAIFYHITYHF